MSGINPRAPDLNHKCIELWHQDTQQPTHYTHTAIVSASSCLLVLAQWQSTGGSSPWFDSQGLLAFYFLLFCLIISSVLFQLWVSQLMILINVPIIHNRMKFLLFLRLKSLQLMKVQFPIIIVNWNYKLLQFEKVCVTMILNV